jgi:hypothetical protein
MRNITFSMDEELIEKGKAYAKAHGISFNALIRRLLEKHVLQDKGWIEDAIRLMDAAEGRSGGRKWRREDLYDV